MGLKLTNTVVPFSCAVFWPDLCFSICSMIVEFVIEMVLKSGWVKEEHTIVEAKLCHIQHGVYIIYTSEP